MKSSILERLTKSSEPAKKKLVHSKYGDEKVHKSTVLLGDIKKG